MTALRLAACAAALLAAGPASAHVHMLLPDKPSVDRGEVVAFTFQFGHPFEHQLADASRPARLLVHTPEGANVNLTDALEEVRLDAADGKKVTAFRFTYRPAGRGDYHFIAVTPPVWMADERRFLQDTVQVLLHVRANNGWDRPGRDFPWAYQTRPYGLLPGTVFEARVQPTEFMVPPRASVTDPSVQADFYYEVERYNAAPPKEVPADEFVTRAGRTGAYGAATVSLPEAGWWGLTAHCNRNDRQLRDGQDYPVLRRASVWVHVADKPAPAAEKK